MKPCPVFIFLNGLDDFKMLERLLKAMNMKDVLQQAAMRKLTKKFCTFILSNQYLIIKELIKKVANLI